MITFEGKLSKKCTDYCVRIEKNIERLGVMLICAIFCFPAFIPAFTEDSVYFLWAIGFPACVLAVTFIPTPEKEKKLLTPAKVTIDVEYDEIFTENEDFCVTKNLSEVTVVYDMGEWYHIHFGCKYDRWARFICQKDLIQGATIEEFEKLFENKIVRKFSAKKN